MYIVASTSFQTHDQGHKAFHSAHTSWSPQLIRGDKHLQINCCLIDDSFWMAWITFAPTTIAMSNTNLFFDACNPKPQMSCKCTFSPEVFHGQGLRTVQTSMFIDHQIWGNHDPCHKKLSQLIKSISTHGNKMACTYYFGWTFKLNLVDATKYPSISFVKCIPRLFFLCLASFCGESCSTILLVCMFYKQTFKKKKILHVLLFHIDFKPTMS